MAAAHAGVSSADISTLGALLQSIEPMIVDDARGDAGDDDDDGAVPSTIQDAGPG